MFLFGRFGNILTNFSPHRRRRQDQMRQVSKAIQLFFRQGRKKLRVVGLECTNFHGRFLSSETPIRFTMKHSPSEELHSGVLLWLRILEIPCHRQPQPLPCIFMFGAPLFRQQRSKRCQHDRFELLEVDALRKCQANGHEGLFFVIFCETRRSRSAIIGLTCFSRNELLDTKYTVESIIYYNPGCCLTAKYAFHLVTSLNKNIQKSIPGQHWLFRRDFPQ